MQEAELGTMLETFLLSTGTRDTAPTPPPFLHPPTCKQSRAKGSRHHPRLPFLSRVEAAILPTSHSKAQNKPAAPKPSPLLGPEATRLNFLLCIWSLWPT